MTEAARLRQDVAESRKEMLCPGAKLASLKVVGDEIAATKMEVMKLVTFVAKAHEHCLAKLL